MAKKLTELENIIGYAFSNPHLLSESLTHSSNQDGLLPHGNERLEYIGDAVINLVIAEALFIGYPDYDEGWLTQKRAYLVNCEFLAKKAESIFLGRYLILSKGEEVARGREKSSILSGSYEALIGAVFLDGGYKVARTIVLKFFSEDIKDAASMEAKNYKSALQEILQKGSASLPVYEVVSVSGPDHDRRYTVAVYVKGEEWGRGEGKNKKEAEMEAARAALTR